MASLRHDQIADFVQATQRVFKSPEWADISLSLQKYYFARLLKGQGTKKMRKRPERGGPYLDWKLRVRNQGSFRTTGLYNVDTLNRVNVLDNGEITWSYQDANYIIDTREPKWQSGPEKIIDIVQLDEQGLYNDFFDGIEPQLWSAPSSSTLDPMPIAGIPFWIQKSSTAAFGFNGGNPTGWTSGAGGISTSTYANWKNATFTWAVVSPEDMVEKTIEAMDKCYFEAPQPFPNLVKERPDWGLYSGSYETLKQLRRLAQSQNENLGDDVAKYMNTVTIRGNPVEWVPAMDNSSSDAYDSSRPLYGVNWATLEYFFKEGEAMVRQPMKQSAHSHRVLERFLDNSGNTVCYDRRRNFVGYDSTA